MKQLCFADLEEWRRWLDQNHATDEGIWLVFNKQRTSGSRLTYEEAVEEALCFGWIDSIVKAIDSAGYMRKFTPRNETSAWSALNKKRVQKVIAQGRMTEAGMRKIRAAKRNGRWNQAVRPPVIPAGMPCELKSALDQNQDAKRFFNTLSPSSQRRYELWIATARKPETRTRRAMESVALLAKGNQLGLK